MNDHTRPRNRNDQPDGGPQIRYVQVTAIASFVSVKPLTWTGAAYAVYGNAVDLPTLSTTGIAVGDRFWVVWRRDGEFWERIAGSADRYVGADDDDDRPDELWPKIVDHGTFDDEIHQQVFAQVVADPAPDPEMGSYNKVRFFTAQTTGSPPGVFRLASGFTTSDVAAEDTTFHIDSVAPLASGLDPGPQIQLRKPLQEAFIEDTLVTGIYDASGPGVWSMLNVERHRLIRGDYYATVDADARVFEINHIKLLSSGVDPRIDPASAVETIWVKLVDGVLNLSQGDKVYAVYSPNVSTSPQADWEMLPKPKDGADGASGTFMCTLTGNISASPGLAGAAPGTGEVYKIKQGGLFESLGTRTIYNTFRISMPSSAAGKTIQYVCAKTYQHNEDDDETEEDDEFTITGIDPMHRYAAQPGWGEKKSLSVPEGGGASAEDQQFLGDDC